MVALLIGGGSRLMDALINKLNKCGHRVYVLTGGKEVQFSYPRVFEKYNFPYDSDSLNEIFTSIKPDVVIYSGAFDTNYRWNMARKELVQYTADLTNVLSAFSGCNKGRFIYLSSQEVFGRSYVNDIKEEEPVSAKSFKSMAIAQGEEICQNYHNTAGLDTVVLRLDHLYGIPKKGRKDDNPCFQLTLEMLKKHSVSASERNLFSMLHLNDAVEYIYEIVKAKQTKYTLYHLSSKQVISQMELARIIQTNMGKTDEIVDASVGEGYRLVLDNQRFKEEFEHRVFGNYEKCVPKVVQYMKRNRDSFSKEEDQGIGQSGRIWSHISRIFRLLVPYMENMVCFIPFFMLNNRAVGSQYFDRLDFYLLYVLLFAIVYGQQQAIFSALLATAGYFFRQMYEQSEFEVLLNYNTYVWMAQIFILGMVVGYMRDQITFIKTQKEEEIAYLSEQLNDMLDINDSNVRMKKTFESQIINQKDSLGKIYSITSKLDQYQPEEVLFYAARILEQLMDSKDVAIYTVENDDYARLFSFTSDVSKVMGNSVKYMELDGIYDELKEHRVYINKTLQENYPLMANAIYADDKMQLILMVWGIPWERMNLAEANRLMVIGYLIQNAVVRANRYLDALREERYLNNTDILEEEAFTNLVHAFSDAKRNELTECTLLEIQAKEKDYLTVAQKLSTKLRKTDYIGILNHHLCVLLSNTNEQNASYVIGRFAEIGCESNIAGWEVMNS